MKKIDILEQLPKQIVSNTNRRYTLHVALEGKQIPKNKEVVPERKIGLWYETKTPTNGKILFYQILPRFIPKTKILFESVGLYKADGSVTLSTGIVFSNDEPNAINKIMKCFKKCFNVPYSDWIWHIDFNDRLKHNETPEEAKEREIGSINFWLKKTHISPKSVSATAIRYSNKTYEGGYRIKRRWGSLSISLGNRILKNVWMNLIDKLVEETIKNKDKKAAADILRGWIAGDGCCSFKIYEYQIKKELSVLCKNKKDRTILEKLFFTANLYPNTWKWTTSIQNIDGFIKSYKLNLSSLNPYKYKNHLLILNSYSSTIHKKKIEQLKHNVTKDLERISKIIKRREDAFYSLKNEKLPKLGKNEKDINWKFILNVLVAKFGSRKIINEIGCGKHTLFLWLNQDVKPSEKYRIKILELVDANGSEKEFIEFGNWLESREWNKILLGLQILLCIKRKNLAKILDTHVNSIEPLINKRRHISRKTAFKILALIKKLGKTPKEIEILYERSLTFDWNKTVKQILIQKRFSQRKLAEELKCSRSLVREWVGSLKPSLEYQGKLLTLFESLEPFRLKDINVSKVVSKALKELTSPRLSEEVGVSKATIYRWRKGNQQPQLRHMQALINLGNKIQL